MTELRTFRDLFAIPLKNGLNRPEAVRGAGDKMINMGELFSNDRIADIPMDLVLLSSKERDDFMVKTYDLLFARQSLVLSGAGKCSLYTGASYATFESHIIRARLDQAISDPRFYYYFFRSPAGRSAIETIVEQVAAAGIRGSDLAGISVPYPPVSEQRAIASVLGALDDKIELNRKMSATLEAIARALFKSWFIDFDPVRARAEGREGALPAEIAALFSDSLEESVHGEIPSGWTIATILDIAMLNPETWSKTTRPNVIRYVDLSTVKWGRFEIPAAFEQSEAPSRAQRVLRPGDTLVGTVRPANGSYGLVSDEGLTGSTGFAVLRPTKSKPFTYLAATSKDNIARLGHLADGGAYPAVRPEVVGGTRVVLPSKNVLCAFDAIATPLLDRYAQADRESRTLAALRDALVPKLISGELRVNDAERVLAASA